MKKTEIQSQEIAKIAGVSRSTVSRVINNHPNVTLKTREKVLKVIEQFNYFPNISAQILAGKKTRTLGLFYIDRWHFTDDVSANMLISSLIASASSKGYYVLSTVVRDFADPDSVKKVKEAFYQRRIDGGIFIGADNHEPVIEQLIAEGYIVGIVDQILPGRSEPNRIVYNLNNERAAKQAVDYLVGLNHKRIGIINGDTRKSAASSKLSAFLERLAHHRLEINKSWILYGNYESGGYEAMSRLLQSASDLPTAFFASNDSIAYGAIRAIHDYSLRVPQDISVIGVNDQKLSAYYKPALTTFRADLEKVTDGIASSVIQAIEHGVGTESVKVTVDFTLIERESCRKLDE